MKTTTTPLPILRIGVDLINTSAFLRVAHPRLPGGWSCAGEWPTSFAYPLSYLRFHRDHGDVSLYLLRTDPDTLSVVSVVPGMGTISPAERAAVLDDFRASVLGLPGMSHFPAVMVQPEKVAEFPPPPEVQKVLDRLAGLLNNGAGFHPFDPTAWPYFIAALHLTKRSISFDWLIDAFSLKHTIPERAFLRLEDSFVSSMKLLRRYDEGLDYKREVELKRATSGSASSTNPQPPAGLQPLCEGRSTN